MATATFTNAPNNNTAADFRTWGLAMSTALAAVGMVKTSDTGQINWATTAAPSTAGEVTGSEMWRFNDSMQATAPLFVKIGYGSGYNTGVNPGLSIQLGKGSNGSCGLTSPMGTAQVIYTSGVSATSYQSYVSNDGSALAVVLWPLTAYPMMFFIERSRAPSGAATVAAVSMCFVSTGIPVGMFYNYDTTNLHPWNPVNISKCFAVPSTNGNLAVSGSAPAFLGLFTDGAGNYWQPRGVVGYLLSDATTLAPVTLTGYGTYLPLGASSGSSSAFYVMIPWS